MKHSFFDFSSRGLHGPVWKEAMVVLRKRHVGTGSAYPSVSKGPRSYLERALRILQVITPARIAGAERSTTSLCEHLVKAGHEVVVACKKNQPLIQVMRDVGLDVRGLAISGKGNVAAALRLARLVRQERIEVI